MNKKISVAFVTSKGGHLGQIKLIFDSKTIHPCNALLITESEKITQFCKEQSFNNTFKTYFFKKDVLRFNPFTYLTTLIRLMKVYKSEQVDLVVTNGAQISIPAVIGARLMGIKTIFIDTVIRVKTPNWSARASYPFSDIFLVQHPGMKKKYGKKAQYAGGVI